MILEKERQEVLYILSKSRALGLIASRIKVYQLLSEFIALASWVSDLKLLAGDGRAFCNTLAYLHRAIRHLSFRAGQAPICNLMGKRS